VEERVKQGLFSLRERARVRAVCKRETGNLLLPWKGRGNGRFARGCVFLSLRERSRAAATLAHDHLEGEAYMNLSRSERNT
jgi:hypothetical protein